MTSANQRDVASAPKRYTPTLTLACTTSHELDATGLPLGVDLIKHQNNRLVGEFKKINRDYLEELCILSQCAFFKNLYCTGTNAQLDIAVQSTVRPL